MFGAESCNNTEHDDDDHPTESFKVMDKLVSEQGDDKRKYRNEDDSHDEGTFATREFFNDLSADNRVDHRPSHTGNDIGTSEKHGAIPSETESIPLAFISKIRVYRGIVIARRPILGPNVAM